MKKRTKKYIAIFVMLFCCYCIVDAVVDTQQKIFPVKAEEISRITITLPKDEYVMERDDLNSSIVIYAKDSHYGELGDVTKKDAIANLINTSPMYVDEAEKNELVSDFSFNPYDKNVVAKLELRYERNFLQRKHAVTLFFYDDGKICVDEVEYMNKPLLIRFINQWRNTNWDDFKIYTIDDMDIYSSFIKTLYEY